VIGDPLARHGAALVKGVSTHIEHSRGLVANWEAMIDHM